MRMHSSHPIIRSAALVVVGAMITPTLLAGCGGQPQSSSPPPPPVDDTRTGRMPPPAGNAPVARKPGLSTKQKVLILAGAAALWYMYNRQKKQAQAQGSAAVQYYRSKNGRIYYRDPQTHQAHWVTPPQEPMQVQVSPEEAQQYQDIQGYNNQQTGRGLADLFPAG